MFVTYPNYLPTNRQTKHRPTNCPLDRLEISRVAQRTNKPPSLFNEEQPQQHELHILSLSRTKAVKEHFKDREPCRFDCEA